MSIFFGYVNYFAYLCNAKGNSATKQKTNNMKRFNLRGTSANWGALKLEAQNTKTDERERRSEIPYGHKVTVHVVDNFYRLYDKRVRQILHGEISDADFTVLLDNLAKSRPDFVLFHDGHVVGYANIHRRRWFRRMQEEPKLRTFEFDVTLKSRVRVEDYNYESAVQQVYKAVDTANEMSEETETETLKVVNVEEIRIDDI